MGALDDAIREHLELKRQHGAAEEEIKRAEAEALGPARRESVAAPEGDFADPGAAYDDLDAEPPPPPPESAVHDAPPPPPGLGPDPVDEFGDEESLAPADDPIADPQATAEWDPFADEEVDLAAPESPAAEPHGAAPAGLEPAFDEVPPAEPAAAGQESAPLPPEGKGEPGFADRDVPAPDPLPVDEPPVDPDRARTAILDDPLDELDQFDDEAAPAPTAAPIHHEPDPDEAPAPARPMDVAPPAPVTPPPTDGDEDVLEETPDFLQETPEHDRLWFEQKPPRDFDFDD